MGSKLQFYHTVATMIIFLYFLAVLVGIPQANLTLTPFKSAFVSYVEVHPKPGTGHKRYFFS